MFKNTHPTHTRTELIHLMCCVRWCTLSSKRHSLCLLGDTTFLLLRSFLRSMWLVLHSGATLASSSISWQKFNLICPKICITTFNDSPQWGLVYRSLLYLFAKRLFPDDHHQPAALQFALRKLEAPSCWLLSGG